MVNIEKVVDEIKNDGKYDAILDVVKKEVGSENPTRREIRNLVDNNPYYIREYKDLNRWGELSSVHVKELKIKGSDFSAVKKAKEQINSNVRYLRNAEEYEVKSKDIVYLAWAGFIALPAIYVIDNIVRLFTDLYTSNESDIYLSFIIVLLLSVWGYIKVKNNHKSQHERYLQTQIDTRELIRVGLENGYFSFEEVYEE